MPEAVLKLVNHTRNQAAYILGFATLFILVGWGIPDLYFRYFDKTDYYQINRFDFDTPEFKRCTPITYTFSRTSLINSEIRRNRELSLLNAETRKEVWREQVNDFIDATTAIIHGEINPPCNLPDGQYMLNILITYQYRGMDKSYMFTSPKFLINSDND
jgi:hypothetical protein